MKEILSELIEHRALGKETARNVLLDIASAKYNNSQVAAFMTVYMMRGVTVEELDGFREAMLDLCLRAEFAADVMDVCGTGGDGKNTFNISTLASFVVAAAGQPVAKHGNYGVSSACGSSNVLEHFGYRFTNDLDVLRRSVDAANICFMHAPLFHPAMKNVAPIRKELGVKTFFNMLGPMVNPAFPKKQLVGVFSLELARMYGYLYQRTDKRFAVLHSLDGYDEISLTGPAKMFTSSGERMVAAEDFLLAPVHARDIEGGNTVEESARIFLTILEGRGTPQQNSAVVANAALALYTAGHGNSLEATAALAQETLASGRAYTAFKKLLEISN